ncbi:hypothetical protein SO694_0002611 [Aureococcus anophagefferens]|uniref:Uncharacterized protein n=1 Tax=Aureococcus anophagefferens TaxID=44056 RepID=A0ABR1FUG9_AURAN
MLAQYNIIRWSLALVRVACLSGGRRSRKPRGPRPPPRVLQRVDGGVPEIARCHPSGTSRCSRPRWRPWRPVSRPAAGGAPPAAEVFESERSGFRMRASFQVWREGSLDHGNQTRHLVMYERGGEAGTPSSASTSPWARIGSGRSCRR